jgi:hypothetical protein
MSNIIYRRGGIVMYASVDEGLTNETRDVIINIRAKKNQRDFEVLQ